MANKELQHHSWQLIDTIPDDESILQPDEVILSINEAYVGSTPTLETKTTSFRVTSRDLLLSSPWLVSRLLSLTYIGSSILDDENDQLVQSVIDNVRATSVTQRKLTVDITMVDSSVDGDEDGDGDDEIGLWAVVDSFKGFDDVEIDRVMGCSEQCSICLEAFLVGSKATTMPCSHSYHRECIFRWLAKGNSCPLCRWMPND